jgi:hypothetical protein
VTVCQNLHNFARKAQRILGVKIKVNWEFVESSPRFIHIIQGIKVAFVKQTQRL